MSKFTVAAEHLHATAFAAGFHLVAKSNGVVTITKSFTPNDANAYMAIESESYQVLRHALVTQPGTTWGSDSASVGGHVALTSGRFVMNKSGVSKALINHLRKIAPATAR